MGWRQGGGRVPARGQESWRSRGPVAVRAWPVAARAPGGALLILAVVLGLWGAWWWHRTASVMEFRGRLVVIDPGHGGKDPGAVGRAGTLEKEITLAVALQLERLLNRAGVYTQLTRRSDVDLADEHAFPRKAQDLRRRALLANQAGADVFVSLHANSFPSSRWSGAQTFYFPDDGEGRRLAESIQEAIRRRSPSNRRQPRPGNYRVLRETTMAAVVVELGFLSNPQEEKLLTDPQHRQALAEAVYEGILAYFTGRLPDLEEGKRPKGPNAYQE